MDDSQQSEEYTLHHLYTDWRVWIAAVLLLIILGFFIMSALAPTGATTADQISKQQLAAKRAEEAQAAKSAAQSQDQAQSVQEAQNFNEFTLGLTHGFMTVDILVLFGILVCGLIVVMSFSHFNFVKMIVFGVIFIVLVTMQDSLGILKSYVGLILIVGMTIAMAVIGVKFYKAMH